MFQANAAVTRHVLCAVKGVPAGRLEVAARRSHRRPAIYGLPLAKLIYEAGIDIRVSDSGDRVRSWSVLKLFEMMTVETYQQFGSEFLVSVLMGAATATASVLIGIGFVWFAQGSRWRTWILYAIVGTSFALPGPLIGSGFSRLLVHFPLLYDSLAAPCLALSIRTLPLAVLILWHAVRTVPQDVLDAGRLDGAGGGTILCQLVMPSIWPAFVVTWLVAFLISIGDLAASQLLLVPGSESLANRVFDRLHGGAYDQVSALFLSLLIFFAGVTAGILWLSSLWTRPTPHGRQA